RPRRVGHAPLRRPRRAPAALDQPDGAGLMTGWGGSTSFEERVAELALGALAALFAVAVLLWATGELAGLLSHGSWPPVGTGDAPGVAIGLRQHPSAPTAGWPATARRNAPRAWLYYGLLAVLVLTAIAASLALAVGVLGRSPELRAAGRVPPGLSRRPSTRRLPRPFL